MTRRLFAAAFLALFVLGVTPSWAHDEFRFVGTVVKMDNQKSRLSMKFKENSKDVTVEIAILADTAITRDKKKVAKSELKPGLSVVVDALGHDYSDLEAVEVRIVPPLGKSRGVSLAPISCDVPCGTGPWPALRPWPGTWPRP